MTERRNELSAAYPHADVILRVLASEATTPVPDSEARPMSAGEARSAATTPVEPTREEKLEAALRDILEAVGAFTPGGWLAGTDEIVRARAVLEEE